jgi:GntR family transcriptional regulator
MVPFKVRFRPGASPYREIIYAVEKSIVCGQMRAGDPFPSVRVLSQALKINPNTVHKAITELVRKGLLEVHSGIGTVIAETPRGLPRERSALLKDELERLVVEAKRISLNRAELLAAVEDHWNRLTSADAEESAGRATKEEA